MWKHRQLWNINTRMHKYRAPNVHGDCSLHGGAIFRNGTCFVSLFGRLQSVCGPEFLILCVPLCIKLRNIYPLPLSVQNPLSSSLNWQIFYPSHFSSHMYLILVTQKLKEVTFFRNVGRDALWSGKTSFKRHPPGKPESLRVCQWVLSMVDIFFVCRKSCLTIWLQTVKLSGWNWATKNNLKLFRQSLFRDLGLPTNGLLSVSGFASYIKDKQV